MEDKLFSDLRYLQLLSRSFPTIAEASTEIINLEAILALPKGTEHFLADIHGEYEPFQHVLKNASGNIKRKVNELFGCSLRESEKRELCTLIYYPEEKLELVKASEKELYDWYVITLHQLIAVLRDVSSKYTRSKVQKALPRDFSYIIQELLHERAEVTNKTEYINGIINSIISTRRADDFIIAITGVIQRLSIDSLHILGDIYDRGQGAHIILDTLKRYNQWDIQWGNHDILWMGAAAGNIACICNVIRLSLRYSNLTTLEEAYGINLVPLATFAIEAYADDECREFYPRILQSDNAIDERQKRIIAQMHKAIFVLQMKTEAALFAKHPEWNMQGRSLLSFIDYQSRTITLDGVTYPLTSANFPTVDPSSPNTLTEGELQLVEKLQHAFLVSEKMRKHMRLLLTHGSMYSVTNGNLLYHASIPLNEDGTIMDVEILPGKSYKGKLLLDEIDKLIRAAFESDTPQADKQHAIDFFLYLWSGTHSPLFDKSKMATFERYFIADRETHKEKKGAYYRLRDNQDIVEDILDNFGVEGDSRHIINGHVPVHVSEGENPVKAGGKLMVIDGGFSRAYHSQTGIAGYTLVYHSRGFQLVQHEPFTSRQEAIDKGIDIKSTYQIVEMSAHRMRVADTDKGREISQQIEDLKNLLKAYRYGYIKEKTRNRSNK